MKRLVSMIIAALLSLSPGTTIWAQESTAGTAESPTHNPMPVPMWTPAMAAGMNPMVYMNMMPMMMNPLGLMQNPVQSCTQCHTGEDIARFQKTLGPFLALMNPVQWMNPNTYMQMMMMPMSPEAYTEWFNAWMKKSGMEDMMTPAK